LKYTPENNQVLQTKKRTSNWVAVQKWRKSLQKIPTSPKKEAIPFRET